jgi:hypothetical protein
MPRSLKATYEPPSQQSNYDPPAEQLKDVATGFVVGDDDRELRPQEKRLIDDAARGKWWQPKLHAAGPQDDSDLKNVEYWHSERTLRATVVRCLIVGDIWPGQAARWPVHSKGVQIWLARISGNLDLVGAQIDRALFLHNCVFDRQVSIMDARSQMISFNGSRLPSLNAVRARIKGSLYLSEGLEVDGETGLADTKIGGGLVCTGGKFRNKNGISVDLSGANIRGGVHLNEGFEAIGEVNLLNTTIDGVLSCSNGTFHNEGKSAINANGATVSHNVAMNGSFRAEGGVSLVAAEIGGQLQCDGGSFLNEGHKALNASGTRIRSSVFLTADFEAHGEVNFVGAEIDGDFGCDGGTFRNPGKIALDASPIRCRNLYMRYNFNASGSVELAGANVEGHLQCRGGVFVNEGGDALTLNYAQIGSAIRFEGKMVEGRKWPAASFTGRLDLSQATCRSFSDAKAAWPKKGKLVLDGFTYERFHDCPTDWKSRRKWLKLQIRDHLDNSFRPQPWTQAVEVLRAMGHEREAKELAVCRELARAQSRSTKLHIKLWHFLLRITVGNGYKPSRALWWSLAFVMAGWLVFATAGSLGYMAPRDGNVRVTEVWNHPEKNKTGVPELPRTYPPFNSFVYALDAYLPIIEFGQEQAWEPSTKKSIAVMQVPQNPSVDRWLSHAHLKLPQIPESFFAAGWHRVVYWVEEFLGWIFVSLFIAGMSGIMKQE